MKISPTTTIQTANPLVSKGNSEEAPAVNSKSSEELRNLGDDKIVKTRQVTQKAHQGAARMITETDTDPVQTDSSQEKFACRYYADPSLTESEEFAEPTLREATQVSSEQVS